MPVTAPKPRKRLTRKESRAQTRATLIAVPGTGYTGTIRPNPTGAPISMSRGSQHLNMLRHLRLRRITPALLHIKITSAEQVAIVDLLSFEEGHEGLAGIPGAVRMDPARLRSRIRVVVPENVGIVLYCSSSGELTSARVAVALQKMGISNIWVLEGGLSAWKKDGFPVTVHLSTSSEVTERFGIKVIEIDSGATL